MGYVDDKNDFNDSITPMYFPSMSLKYVTPLLIEDDGKDADYKPIKETSNGELLKVWKKEKIHLKNLRNIWYGEYILSLRARYQNKIKAERMQSNVIPKIRQIEHIKGTLMQI